MSLDHQPTTSEIIANNSQLKMEQPLGSDVIFRFNDVTIMRVPPLDQNRIVITIGHRFRNIQLTEGSPSEILHHAKKFYYEIHKPVRHAFGSEWHKFEIELSNMCFRMDYGTVFNDDDYSVFGDL
jgi:hypothetical protein